MDTGLKRAADAFKTVDWVVPAYFTVGAIDMLASAIDSAASEQRQAILRDVLPSFYNDDYLAAMLVERYSATIYVRDFRLPIAESIEAAVMGLPHAAVSTLAPVLEGVLRKIAAERKGPEENGKKFFIIPELDELIAKEERSTSRRASLPPPALRTSRCGKRASSRSRCAHSWPSTTSSTPARRSDAATRARTRAGHAAASRPTRSTPLIVSQSFMTVQVVLDAMLLSWHDTREMTASFPAVMWFWLPFGFLQVAAGYTSTFVAQYTGAGRPHRVRP